MSKVMSNGVGTATLCSEDVERVLARIVPDAGDIDPAVPTGRDDRHGVVVVVVAASAATQTMQLVSQSSSP